MNIDFIRNMLAIEIANKQIAGMVILAKPASKDISFEINPGYRVVDIAMIDSVTLELVDCVYLEYPSQDNPLEVLREAIGVNPSLEKLVFLDNTSKYIWDNWSTLKTIWGQPDTTILFNLNCDPDTIH
jgi:hypothetical protein